MKFYIQTLLIPCAGTFLVVLIYIWLAWYVLHASTDGDNHNNNTNNDSSKGGIGLSKDDIQKLPTFICNCRRHQDNEGDNITIPTQNNEGDNITIRTEEGVKNDELCIGEDLECCVCLEEFKDGERCLMMPTCRHCFHAVCADAWLSKRPICPLCRTTALPKDEEQCPIPHNAVIDILSQD